MRAKAPGKVVLSGAYSVLEGAPAIVAAVDRYVTADSRLPGDFLTDEVRAAGLVAPIWFDASPLRHKNRKLGLGSSAAILVATLGALELEQAGPLSPPELATRIFPRAFAAHRTAQGGGSGIDVAAACYGEVLEFRRDGETPHFQSLPPASALYVEVWSSDAAASTASMLSQIRTFALRDPTTHRRDIQAQADAAQATLDAWRSTDHPALLRGLMAQRDALQRLGTDAGVPIVTPQVAALAEVAARAGAAVLPAGAGGGDIALYIGLGPSTFMTDELSRFDHTRLPLRLGAPGVHAE